jgi:hypothetical protein
LLFDARVGEQPHDGDHNVAAASYGSLPPTLIALASMPVFAKDPRVYFTRRFFGFMYEIPECGLHYRSRFQNKLPVEYSDMIRAGKLPNLVGLFPLGLVPAESLGANEAAAIPRP